MLVGHLLVDFRRQGDLLVVVEISDIRVGHTL